ncbi:hypothetical protein Vadar_020140 [Vaccinium darrowii]|uniref:Uncharacterized protein n=1 Tax=Vaccinium darrowii TaxID=229202 RepID=A0ACB7ZLN5_9ERIC|nr:hypothetical protein Vadar_020140 [Vaccinium darrowii]
MVKMKSISKESIKPSLRTPDHLRTFRLSLIDQFISPLVYMPVILYYSHDECNGNIKQAEIAALLKRSLSDTLSLYYPFAGRMMGESSINCDDQGIDFLEARVDASLSEIMESSKVEVLTQFVPSTSEESGGVLLGIQLNYYNCGGISIGITLCHRIADGCTFSMFVKAWAAKARGDTDLELASLRAEVEATVVQPTRVELVTAAIWKWAMARKARDGCRRSVACHAVNIRGRMDPPLSEYTFGNLIRGADALGNSEMGLGELVSKTREAIGKIDNEYLKELQGENGYDMVVGHSNQAMEWFFDKEVDYFMFTSCCRFSIYESDFGWGKPVWVSSASWGAPNTIVLMDSMSDIGGIEAWFTMDEDGTHDEIGGGDPNSFCISYKL